ncbi:MAG: diaminopimelate decarboxylase [Acidobacteria bacterium]|nr:diaminopimelate decarboxylase [Acidobacteriota bacterium]
MTPKKSEISVRPPAFLYSAGLLHCEGASLRKLAERFGTPLYVYSAGLIRERVRAFDKAFRGFPHTVCYSVKANSNLSLLRLLARMGCGFDVVSGGELARVQKAAPRAVRSVVFSGVGKTANELKAALKAGILLFNVESEAELHVLAECAAQLKKTASLAMRVNPDVSAETHPYISTGLHQHKFGVPIQQARALYALAAKQRYLRPAGVSVHIGSQITDVSPFGEAMERVAQLVRELHGDGHAIRYVDAGGGLGIAYQDFGNFDFVAAVTKYAGTLTKPLRGLGLHLLLEPGRSIVGPAGTLLTRVVYEKTNGGKKFVIVDAAMNDLIRPSLYSAYHEIIPVQAPPETAYEQVDVVGPICETGDFFARERKLPATQSGDLLAVLDAGAYGMSLASNYNTRPKAAEVLVDKKSAKIIRRRETIADLLRQEL